MKVSYTGIHPALSSKLQEKLDARFHKLAKLLDHPGGERAAHVVVTGERHLRKAEITLQIHDHSLIGLAAHADLFAAVWNALEKLEKQAVKQISRGREKARRHSRAAPAAVPAVNKPEVAADEAADAATVVAARKAASPSGKLRAAETATKVGAVKKPVGRKGARPRIFSVRDHAGLKPMTLDEAMLEMEDGRGYIVYRDAEREMLTMLVRRPDGHFDLIET